MCAIDGHLIFSTEQTAIGKWFLLVLPFVLFSIIFSVNEYCYRRGLQNDRNLKATIPMSVVVICLFGLAFLRYGTQFSAMTCQNGDLILFYKGGHKQVLLQRNDIKEAKIVKYNLRMDHSFHVYIVTITGESHESTPIPIGLLDQAATLIGQSPSRLNILQE